jgi:RNA polymerase sigma factor (sigma-70 family)
MTDGGESDESLISRYASGDAAAFASLYHRHEMRVWRYLKRNVENRATADELLQEVWFAVARDAARYRPTARFTTWLFAIAHNRLIDVLRGSRAHLSLDSIGHEAPLLANRFTTDEGSEPLAAVLVRDQAQALARALGTLPHEQREAFLLQVEAELSVEEVASVTGSSFETTKSRLRYARSRLRALLGEYA